MSHIQGRRHRTSLEQRARTPTATFNTRQLQSVFTCKADMLHIRTYVGPVATIGNFPAMSNPSTSEPKTSAGAMPDSIRHGKWVVFRPMALQEKTTVAVLTCGCCGA